MESTTSVYDKRYELLKSGDFADCTIIAGAQQIRAHRCILAAASPYFRKRFRGFPEQTCISIPSSISASARHSSSLAEPTSAFMTVLKYCYNAEFEYSQSNLQEIKTVCTFLEIFLDASAMSEVWLHVPPSANVSYIQHHFSSLSQRFFNLLSSEELYDITINAGGEKFQAHRCILAAASPYFKSLFTSPMVESEMPEITIRHPMAAQVFRSQLMYAYTGKLMSLGGDAKEVSDAADYFGILPVRKGRIRQSKPTPSI
jgi:hypothetical protein